MNKVYLVKGHTGEYEDRHEWIARAFSDREKAEDMAGELNKLLENSSKLKYEEREELESIISRTVDPRISMDYTGTYYHIEEVDVE